MSKVTAMQVHMSRRVARLRREATRLELIGDRDAAYFLRARAMLWYRTYRLSIARDGQFQTRAA